MSQPISRITLLRNAAPVAPVKKGLSRKEKAAVIVRFLLAEGAAPPIGELPEHIQAALTEQIAAMRLVDRKTLDAVVEEFLGELEQVGLAFPGGIEAALQVLDGHISAQAASRIRRLAGASGKVDPWERILPMPVERLLPVLDAESVEVGAVLLSKLPVAKAADLLGRLPGERARRIAHAMALTGNVNPETVRRIGMAIAAQFDAEPPRAFETGPEQRVGAILNLSAAKTRAVVLEGLEEDDAAFAEKVKKTIFTFAHIPARLQARDVAKVTRIVAQADLMKAIAGATSDDDRAAAEFLLSNLSQRLAQSLREEIGALGTIRAKQAEEAQLAIIEAIRMLEAQGEIVLRTGAEGDAED
jgi:flagellar motor switch protein FliG